VVKIQLAVFWIVVPWLYTNVADCTSTLKREAVWSSETLVSKHYPAWHNNPDQEL